MALTISITSDCNLDCRTCGGWDFTNHLRSKGHNYLPYETITRILDEGKKRGNRYLDITGGEPFLHPDIIKILLYAEQSGYWISILTNGLLLDEKLIQSLSTIRARIRISFYSADKKTHEYFSGENTYDPLVNIIRNLREKRLYFGIGMPVFKKNINEIEETVKFAIDEGCAFIRVSPGAKYHKAMIEDVDSSLFEEMIFSIIQSIIKYRDYVELELDSSLKIPNPIEILTTRRCTAGCNFYFIDSAMKVYPCPYISTKNLQPMNFKDYRDFYELDNFMDNYFEKLTNNLTGMCNDCEYHTICSGGCLSEKTTRGLRSHETQPICLRKILHRVVNRFNPELIEDILQAWAHLQYKDLYEDFGNRDCMRRLPIWTINFKGWSWRG
jgi:radical SAM protein with 4Fe4S-binding SPASM domain